MNRVDRFVQHGGKHGDFKTQVQLPKNAKPACHVSHNITRVYDALNRLQSVTGAQQ
jgi:hypothetical protein